MFDIGFWEFALIGVITLLVVGPERMPDIARKAGAYVAKAKRFIANIQADIGEELESDKIKAHLNLNDEDNNIVELLDDAKNTLTDIKQDAEQGVEKHTKKS